MIDDVSWQGNVAPSALCSFEAACDVGIRSAIFSRYGSTFALGRSNLNIASKISFNT